jgi:hypothetical protein
MATPVVAAPLPSAMVASSPSERSANEVAKLMQEYTGDALAAEDLGHWAGVLSALKWHVRSFGKQPGVAEAKADPSTVTDVAVKARVEALGKMVSDQCYQC